MPLMIHSGWYRALSGQQSHDEIDQLGPTHQHGTLSRCSQFNSRLTRSAGARPLTIPAATSLFPIFQAQAATYGPPPETPATAKRSRLKASASSLMSSTQSSSRRWGCTSDRPKPGRSGAINRTPISRALDAANLAITLEPGVP